MAPTSRLRVLHVLEALEGGTARHVVDVVRHVRDVEHLVALPERRIGGQTDDRAADRMRAAGATVHVVRMTRTPWTTANAGALAPLRRLARGVEVVHGHSSIGGLLARLAGLGGPPVVYTPNGITDVRVGLLVERALRPLTARLIAVSASEGADALRLGLATPSSLVVVPNGIEQQVPDPPGSLRARLGVPSRAPLVGSVSRLVAQKAPLDLLGALARVVERSDAHAVIVGDGPMREAVMAAARALPAATAARIHLVDSLPDVASTLGELDVFVLASRFEGAPYAPLEAMRAGTAVVLTAVTGNVDTVIDGRTGLLVPAGDPEALADAVLRLLADDGLRTRLGTAGRAWVQDQRDLTVMGQRLRRVYEGLVADGQSLRTAGPARGRAPRRTGS